MSVSFSRVSLLGAFRRADKQFQRPLSSSLTPAKAQCFHWSSHHPPKALSFPPLEADYRSTVRPFRNLMHTGCLRKQRHMSQEVLLLFSPVTLIPSLSCHPLLICRVRASLWEIMKIIIVERVIMTEMAYFNS